MRFIPGIRYIDPSALGWDALPAGAAPVWSDAAWNLRLLSISVANQNRKRKASLQDRPESNRRFPPLLRGWVPHPAVPYCAGAPGAARLSGLP